MAIAFAGVIPALAAPPANDNFNSATVIGALPFTTTQDTSEATGAVDDPVECYSNGSVWYSFTATSDVLIAADTLGSNYDTTLAVYTGAQGALTLVPGACNDDFFGLQSKVEFNATSGTTYYFLLGVCCGNGGNGGGNLEFTVRGLVPPSNDNFADVESITSLPFSSSLDPTAATNEPDEPGYCYTVEKTVWYSFTPTATMAVELDTQGSTTEANINIYQPFGNGLPGLSFVGCTGSYGGSYSFIAEAGQTYFFQASLFPGHYGTLQINLEQLPPPVNDNFMDATAIPSLLPFEDSVNTLAATIEEGEPAQSCANPGKTAWYAFTPAASGAISARSTGNVPTTIAAYTGSSLGSLSEVGCRPYWNQPLTFFAEAGTTYYFQLGNLYDQAGLTQFHLEITPPPFAGIYFSPYDPSIFDVIQFCDQSYEPGGIGLESFEWDLGDGTTSTDYCLTHRFAADGEYTVQHSVTTYDGRTGSTSQIVQVRTRDVSIIKVSAPNMANVGQKKNITISLRNTRYPENVRIELYKSVAGGGFERVASLTKLVPVRRGNRTTQFSFNYTFTAADAQIGKVIFKAVVILESGRDAFPADNESVAIPPTVVKGSLSYP